MRPNRAAHNKLHAQHRRRAHHQAVCQNFRSYDFGGGYRHHQQMLHRAALALTNHRRAHQHQRNQHNIIARHRRAHKPTAFVVWVVLQIDHRAGRHGLADLLRHAHKLLDFAAENLRNIARAHARLRHRRGIHQKLRFRRAPRLHIALKIRRKLQHKSQLAFIQHLLRVVGINVNGLSKLRRQQRGNNLARERAAVVIHNADVGVSHIGCGVGGGVVHHRAEHHHDEHHQHRVAKQAAQFFGGKGKDVF